MWVIYAFLTAIIGAVYNLTMQNMKIDANTFMVYRGIVLPIILLPFLLLNPIVFSRNFYIMSLLQGLISAYVDYLVFGLNKKYGSEVISSITPFSVIIIFFTWCFIDNSIATKYLQNFYQSCLILLSLSGIVFSLKKYYNVTFTREAFIKMIPILVLSAMFAILNKTIMNYSESNQFLCALWQAFIVCSVVSIIHLFIYKRKKLPFKNLFLMKNLIRSLIFILSLIFMVLKSLAMYYTDNPAYVSCIVYTSFIWVMLFSRYIPVFNFAQAKKQGEKKWKILFVFSIILMILVTN